MRKIQRLGGRLGQRSADEASVGAVIAEFKQMDVMLEKLMKDLQDWRNSWEDILKLQYDAAEAFATLYNPIEPTTHPEMRHVPQETPRSFAMKCTALHKMYSETKDDLKQETDMITAKLMRPIEEAKRCTKSMQKTLKHRDNMKLDYERYLGKVEHARKRNNPSPKEIAALERSENDLAQQQIAYNTADQQIVETFPPVTDAVITLIPLLLTMLVELQTTLVGSLYTNLDLFCRKYGLPSAPSDSDIVSKWDAEFTSFRHEVEQSFQTLKGGQAIHRSMAMPEKDTSGMRSRIASMAPGRKTSETTTLTLRHRSDAENDSYPAPDDEEIAPPKPPRPPMSRSVSTTSSHASPPPIPAGKPAPSYSRTPSSSYLAPQASSYEQKPAPRIPSFSQLSRTSHNGSSSPGYASPPSRYATPTGAAAISPAPSTVSSVAGDYFEAGKQMRRPSTNTIGSSRSSLTPGQYTPGLEEILAAKAKKKPPPPVPSKPKPKPATEAQYVKALYDFEGQNPEDLPFREGDRIRVLKKTESTDDWWDGELNGRTGQFPANYVLLWG